MMKKKRLDFRALYRDDVFALLCVFSFSMSIIVGTESMAGLVLTLALDALALGRGVLALMGKCRPVPANVRRVLEGLMIVVFAGTWVFLGFRSLSEEGSPSGAVWTAALVFTGLAMMYFSVNIYDGKKSAERAGMMEEKSRLEQEKNAYKKLYEQVRREKESLLKLRKNARLDKSVIDSIEGRLDVLNKFITAQVSKNQSASASKSLADYMNDKEKFISSTVSVFALTHPDFLAFLKASGLNDWETGCCCLYCIGMNGGEISAYLDRKSFYNDSSLIRKKLGLTRHDMNLDTFLLEKLQNSGK